MSKLLKVLFTSKALSQPPVLRMSVCTDGQHCPGVALRFDVRRRIGTRACGCGLQREIDTLQR